MKAEILAFLSMYFFFIVSINLENRPDKIIFNKSWTDLKVHLIIFSVILGLLGIILSYFQKNKIKSHIKVTHELESYKQKFESLKDEYFKLCSDNIKDIFSDFFKSSQGNGRVSLYKHFDHSFKLLGRYSENPVYKKRGAEIYPDNEGFIAKGWQEKMYSINSIPKWEQKGSKYKNYVKKYCDISETRISNLTMKSCSYYVYRFDSPDSQNHYGVAVFEKINPELIEVENINQIFENNNSRLIALFKSMNSLKL